MARKSILVVDDEKSQREILEMILSGEGYDVTTASSGEAAIKFAKEKRFDLALTDLKMTGMDGIELLQHLLALDSSIIVILLTAHGSIDSAKEALRRGAFDYLEKPYDKTSLLETITRALQRLDALDTEIVSASPNMESVKRMILKVARSNSTVLIRGESGTGKELIARAIHNQSPRAQDMFQAVNCAAINENLLESELFGHEKGSFTGAHAEKKGLFEIADRGTLFLDEIAELDVAMQAKLLRALQERKIRRVGGTHEINVDVRVIAATNRDLKAAMTTGTFRSDLFYRLNVFPVEIPPLRERREDITLLVEYFVDRYASKAGKKMRSINKKSLELLQSYPWPGNIRELQNVIERSVIVCETENLVVDENWLAREFVKTQPPGRPLSEELVARERERIEAVLAEARGRVSGPSGAAAKLGMPRSTLDSKIRSLKINKHRFKTV